MQTTLAPIHHASISVPDIFPGYVLWACRTQFTTSQVGEDTVINMTGGGQMVLVGVSLTTLTGNWIFGA
ncbi:MAG: hypothetical protein ACK56C_11395 [Alphaproteobacteria bacterium]